MSRFRSTVSLVVAAFVAGLVVAPLVAQAAPSQNVKTMAGILAGMNHFASDAQKRTLEDIADSDTATPAEKQIARAMAAVQHTAPEANKASLQALAVDTDEPDGVRVLAGALAAMNHTVSGVEKKILERIAAGS